MIMPLAAMYSGLGNASCIECEISWFCFNTNSPGAFMAITECDKCLKCLFYDMVSEEKYVRSITPGAPALPDPYYKSPDSFNWLEHFPSSLPKCSSGGHFGTSSPHHRYSEYRDRDGLLYPLCPLCRKGRTSLRLFDREARDAMEFAIWVPYMNRLNGVGSNDGYREPIREVGKYFDWDVPEVKKPRFLVGLGLIEGKVTEAF